MINVDNTTIIYIACPARVATGGTELLHQLHFRLRELHFNSFLYYYDLNKNDDDNPVNKRFFIYNPQFSNTIFDNETNILIVPEVATHILFKYGKLKKVIWWLSVDNYYNYLKLKKYSIKRLLRIDKYYLVEKKNLTCFHLAQSRYAMEFLLKNGVKDISFLSDYVNKEFLKNIDAAAMVSKREDIVLFNPSKGLEFTKKIIDAAPKFKWIPLMDMTPQEVAILLRKSKVYIDFGPHPGKDRFPREAAISGCCIITGLKGSAKFYDDIPIPEKYKFIDADENIPIIIEAIELCITNYENEINNFEKYRKIILREEENFERDILQNFCKANQ